MATKMDKFSASLHLKLAPSDSPALGRHHPPSIRRKPRRQPLLLHPPNRKGSNAPRAAQHQAAASMSAVDLVYGLHQAGAVFGMSVSRFSVSCWRVAGAVDVVQDGAARPVVLLGFARMILLPPVFDTFKINT
jgi:hypothetical protein